MKSLLSVGVTLALVVVPGLTATRASAATIVDINGGTSWTGWTSKGFSNQLGVYGAGSTSIVYEIYYTDFVFDNHAKTSGTTGGGPTGGTTGFGTGTFTNGAFANGNKMFGFGVRLVSGGTLGNTATIKFDLDGADYRAASSVGGTDGKISFSTFSQTGDFTIQTNTGTGNSPNGIAVQAANGSFYGGPNTTQTINANAVGGVSGGGDWPWRMFVTSNSYQWIFDLTALKALYGSSRPGFAGIGDVTGDSVIAVNAVGDNQVALDGPVPEPATWAMLIAGFGLTGATMRRRRAIAARA
jgi:hypothetical protein